MTAEEIKALRERLDVSQQTMAWKIGCSISALQKYEQGHRSPSHRVILRLREIETEALAKGAE
jgi:DNA-binding transcriptional regulator YiaG